MTLRISAGCGKWFSATASVCVWVTKPIHEQALNLLGKDPDPLIMANAKFSCDRNDWPLFSLSTGSR